MNQTAKAKPKAAPKTRLFVLSAPSGAGKTTLCKRLLGDFKGQLILSISSTTRAPRGEEMHGREYFFLKKEDFEAKIREGGFAEWATVHDNYYGTSREFIDRAFAEGKSLLLDIDVQGAKSLREAYPNETVRIFIAPPSIQELEVRLIARGTENSRMIQKRLSVAREEMKRAPEFDRTVVNDDLERAYGELRQVVAAALQGSDAGGS
jgi:guanylate kinase